MNSYGKLCTQYYDLDKPQPPPDALAFYLSQADQMGAPILEPMCGSGRFLVPLMQAGYAVTGVDASPEMLAACRTKALQLGLSPDLYQQVLHEMDLPGSYRLALIPSGSFGLITDRGEARESLHRIFLHSDPGGRMVLEADQMVALPEINPDPGESQITRPDGAKIRMISTGQFDLNEQVYHGINRYQLWVQDRMLEQEQETFNLRYYRPSQLSDLLEEAGFIVKTIQAAFDPQRPVNDAESFVVIAERP